MVEPTVGVVVKIDTVRKLNIVSASSFSRQLNNHCTIFPFSSVEAITDVLWS